MISRKPIIPNIKADRKLCLALVKSQLQAKAEARSIEQREREIIEQQKSLAAELTQIQGRGACLTERIEILQGFIKTFSRHTTNLG